MKTIKEYLEEYGVFKTIDMDVHTPDAVYKAMKAVMTDVIKECAYKATIHKNKFRARGIDSKNTSDFEVDKDSILSLINEIN